ncbi:MAG: hypothetical protein V4650_10830 [Pseudomonadota bacterium]
MSLSASLTIRPVSILAAMALAAAMLSGCAGNSPRKPGAAEDKSASRTLDEDDCLRAESRGAPPPVGCPTTTQQNRRTVRPLPTLDDPLNLPTLPGGGVLGR